MIQRSATQLPSADTLLAAVQRGGDVEAWHALVARLTPRLYRVARGLTAWRVLGAQTVVEHAWRAAIRAPGAMDAAATLRQVLLGQVVERALALGDSPRDIARNGETARLAAMRAVALLPQPSRAVLVLADVGGISLTEAAGLLDLPEVRLKAELWHARLAVDTLRGAGTGATPAPPLSASVDAGSAADNTPPSAATPAVSSNDGDATDPMDDDAGVAALWLEAPPDELLNRLANDLHDRSQRRRLAPQMRNLRLPALGALLAVVLSAASVLFWHEAPRLVQNVEAASAPAAVSSNPQPAAVNVDSVRLGAAPVEKMVAPAQAPTAGEMARRPHGRSAHLSPAC